MFKAYKYRIYPNKSQAELIEKHFGACRFVFNLALETKQLAWNQYRKSLNYFDLGKQLGDLKDHVDWLYEINSQSLQMQLRNLDTAFTRFFKGQGQYPNFKSKKGKQTFHCPQNVIIEGNKVYLPKFKQGIRIKFDRSIDGKIKTSTISRTTTGKYFISILIENELEIPVKKKISTDNSVGIDLGISSFIVDSDGNKVDNPKFLRNGLKRISVLQRRLRNKKKGSNNKKKAYKKIAKLHEKVKNQRQDFLHKTSSAIIKRYDTVCIEDLNVKGMIKNHKLAQAISDVSWSEFTRQLNYKAEWYGKNIIQIGRFEPSSKICSSCGKSNKNLTLADRTWTCSCSATHDRDINAAINIKNFALRKHSGQELAVEPTELPTLVGTLK